jgi:hypothetical protein
MSRLFFTFQSKFAFGVGGALGAAQADGHADRRLVVFLEYNADDFEIAGCPTLSRSVRKGGPLYHPKYQPSFETTPEASASAYIASI